MIGARLIYYRMLVVALQEWVAVTVGVVVNVVFHCVVSLFFARNMNQLLITKKGRRRSAVRSSGIFCSVITHYIVNVEKHSCASKKKFLRKKNIFFWKMLLFLNGNYVFTEQYNF